MPDADIKDNNLMLSELKAESSKDKKRIDALVEELNDAKTKLESANVELQKMKLKSGNL